MTDRDVLIALTTAVETLAEAVIALQRDNPDYDQLDDGVRQDDERAQEVLRVRFPLQEIGEALRRAD